MANNYFFPLKKSKILRKDLKAFWISEKFQVSDHHPYWKNKLLLNEYLRNFRHFESIFFMENDFFKPTHQKDGKFNDFLNPSLSQMLRVEYNLADAI